MTSSRGVLTQRSMNSSPSPQKDPGADLGSAEEVVEFLQRAGNNMKISYGSLILGPSTSLWQAGYWPACG
jgi:hypothetical protein